MLLRMLESEGCVCVVFFFSGGEYRCKDVEKFVFFDGLFLMMSVIFIPTENAAVRNVTLMER